MNDRTRRILVLHGLRLSGVMMRELMHDVLQSCADANWEWTFVDAPNEASGPVRGITRKRWPEGPYREWWNATEQPDGSVKYIGLRQTLELMREQLTEGPPYDMIAGYSQGGTLVHALTALQERAGFLPKERAWRSALLFNSGVPARDPSLTPVLAGEPLQTPSIHVLGGPADVLYESQKAMLTRWAPTGRTVVEHAEGHVPPSRAASPEALAQLRDALETLLNTP